MTVQVLIRVAAILHMFIAVGIGVFCIPAIWNLLNGRDIPIVMGLPAYGRGPFERAGVSSRVEVGADDRGFGGAERIQATHPSAALCEAPRGAGPVWPRQFTFGRPRRQGCWQVMCESSALGHERRMISHNKEDDVSHKKHDV